jgi:hypothetical protein
MSAILRIIAESDDDGNIAEGNTVEARELPKTKFKSEDKRPWLTEKAFNKAIEQLKEDAIDVKDVGLLTPDGFVNWILETYQMKRIYKEKLDYTLKIKNYGSDNVTV